VAGSEARFGQVFLNLLLNAAQAIPEGDPERNEVRVVVHPLGGLGRVAIDVCDTGTGIAPENRERVFEPFFTTKKADGTGLGLSICHRIVTAAGGTLTAQARHDRGTVFRVILPIVSVADDT
jgi:signal transduction histidine kinase